MPVHLDGARLPNAAAATGIAMAEYAAEADTVMVALSKGLGAPVGSVLAGSADDMQRAWRIRRRLGGGMRQAGFLAAAGLYALRNHLPAAAAGPPACAGAGGERHGDLGGLTVAVPETNIVMIDLADPAAGAGVPAGGDGAARACA